MSNLHNQELHKQNSQNLGVHKQNSQKQELHKQNSQKQAISPFNITINNAHMDESLQKTFGDSPMKIIKWLFAYLIVLIIVFLALIFIGTRLEMYISNNTTNTSGSIDNSGGNYNNLTIGTGNSGVLTVNGSFVLNGISYTTIPISSSTTDSSTIDWSLINAGEIDASYISVAGNMDVGGSITATSNITANGYISSDNISCTNINTNGGNLWFYFYGDSDNIYNSTRITAVNGNAMIFYTPPSGVFLFNFGDGSNASVYFNGGGDIHGGSISVGGEVNGWKLNISDSANIGGELTCGGITSHENITSEGSIISNNSFIIINNNTYITRNGNDIYYVNEIGGEHKFTGKIDCDNIYSNDINAGNHLYVGLRGANMVNYNDQFSFNVPNTNDYYLFSFGSLQQYCLITNSGFYPTSDYRTKENIEPIPDTFTVDNLKPVCYKYKDSDILHTGFIAHELQEEFPHMVIGEKDGANMQTVNLTEMIAILVKEVQVLKSTVKELNIKIDELEKTKCLCNV